MKYLALICCLIFSVNSHAQGVVMYVEQEPKYTGGPAAQDAFINQHVEYAASFVKKHDTAVRHMIKVQVTPDGKITDPLVVKGSTPGQDSLLRKLVLSMPAWTPAKRDGKSVPWHGYIKITLKYEKGMPVNELVDAPADSIYSARAALAAQQKSQDSVEAFKTRLKHVSVAWLQKFYGTDGAQMIIDGKVEKGWQPKPCRLALGEPDSVEKTQTGKKDFKEVWRYNNGKYKTLYFTNGHLELFVK